MTDAISSAELRSAAVNLMASADPVLRAIGIALAEYLAGAAPSMEAALGLKRQAGQRRPETKAALELRDRNIVLLHARFGWSAEKIEAGLARYLAGEFRHHRGESECPVVLRGTPRELLWAALRARPIAIKCRSIKEILCSELAIFAAQASGDADPANDNDNSQDTPDVPHLDECHADAQRRSG